jgi:hypothetical protein
MSDTDEMDAKVLGKRVRDADPVPGNENSGELESKMDEDSDDDVGPMPLSEGAAGNGAVKKKRKGEYLYGTAPRTFSDTRTILSPSS